MKIVYNGEMDPRLCRDVLGKTIQELVAKDDKVIYLDADLMSCIATAKWSKTRPDLDTARDLMDTLLYHKEGCVGMAANMIGVAAGLASAGFKPIAHTFGPFASRRCYDQIYMSAAYADLTVHVLGSDAGVSAAFNGGTHMPLEDAAMYMSIPEATVFDPCDYDQMESIVRQLPGIEKGVTFTRFVRKDVIKVYDDESTFEIGKGVVLHESENDVATIISSGIVLDEALKAYEALKEEGITVRVIDMFTWKPLDEELVIKAAKETGAIVTAENHNTCCGLGSVVANCLAKNCPTVQEFVGVQDLFGQVGPQAYLMDTYGLRAANIVEAVKKAIARK